MRTCDICRFWSEMCAQVIDGQIEAVCLCQTSGKTGKFVRANYNCPEWRSNDFGAVDSPPDYGETARIMYQKQDDGLL